MILETVRVGPMQVNCYILAEREKTAAIIIDPGDDEAKIRRVLRKNKLKPGIIINTHGHMDHIGCDDEFGVDIYAHAEEVKLLTDAQLNLSTAFAAAYAVKSKIKTLTDTQKLTFGGIELEAIHTPGHTAGGIALWLKKPGGKILFTGDTLFCGSVGRTDFPGADGELIIKSIKERLLKFPDDTVIYPGHGPTSTIGRERKTNPFLN